jgi:hypothetical protein
MKSNYVIQTSFNNKKSLNPSLSSNKGMENTPIVTRHFFAKFCFGFET